MRHDTQSETHRRRRRGLEVGLVVACVQLVVLLLVLLLAVTATSDILTSQRVPHKTQTAPILQLKQHKQQL